MKKIELEVHVMFESEHLNLLLACQLVFLFTIELLRTLFQLMKEELFVFFEFFVKHAFQVILVNVSISQKGHFLQFIHEFVLISLKCLLQDLPDPCNLVPPIILIPLESQGHQSQCLDDLPLILPKLITEYALDLHPIVLLVSLPGTLHDLIQDLLLQGGVVIIDQTVHSAPTLLFPSVARIHAESTGLKLTQDSLLVLMVHFLLQRIEKPVLLVCIIGHRSRLQSLQEGGLVEGIGTSGRLLDPACRLTALLMLLGVRLRLLSGHL